MSDDYLKVMQLRVENVRGIEALTLDFGRITVLCGENGAGKTSALDATKMALGMLGGTEYIRLGMEDLTASLTLSNGWIVERTVVNGRPKFKVVDADGVVLSKPAERVRELVEGMALDPVRFAKADAKDQLAQLLSMINSDAVDGRMAQIGETVDLRKVDTRRNHDETVVEYMKRVRATVFGMRTDVNRALKDGAATVKTLRSSLPPEAEIDKRGDKAEQELQAIVTERAERVAKMDEVKSTGRACRDRALSDKVQALSDQIAEAKQDRAESEVEANNTYRDAIAEIDQEFAVRTRDLEEFVKEQQRAKEEHARGEGLRDQVAKEEERVETLEERTGKLSGALEEIDQESASLMSQTGIDGVEWDGEQLTYNGVPLHSLSTGESLRFAVQAMLPRLGRVRAMCVDNMESLDAKGRKLLDDLSKEHDFQIIAARVVDGVDSLTVKVRA